MYLARRAEAEELGTMQASALLSPVFAALLKAEELYAIAPPMHLANSGFAAMYVA